MQNDGCIIFGTDRLVDKIPRRQNFPGKSFKGFYWFLADLIKGFEVRIDFINSQARDKGEQVKPVRTDIANSAQCATQFRFEPPIPISGEDQPVLQIRALYDEEFPQFTLLHDIASLLYCKSWETCSGRETAGADL